MRERDAGRAAKDRVVGDEGQIEPSGAGRDPAIGLVMLLAERMPGSHALVTQGDIGVEQLGIWPDNLGLCKPSLKASQALLAPTGMQCTEA
jgi:hypothetical protein